MTEDEMVGWLHQLNGPKFEQVLGDGERQGTVACCSPWDPDELDIFEWLNNNYKILRTAALLKENLSSTGTSSVIYLLYI